MAQSEILQFATEVAFKVSILLLLCTIVCFLIRKSSPSIRRFLWFATMILSLSLPLIMAWLPALELPLPSALKAMTENSAPSQTGSFVNDPNAALPLPGIDQPRSDRATASGIQPNNTFLFVWGAGVLLILGFIVLNLGSGRRILQSSSILSEDSLPHEWSTWSRHEDSPTICTSPSIASPVCVGFLKPSIVLPETSRDWDEKQRLAVILHEYGHVTGRDNLLRAVALLACAIYWFHPLIWLAYFKFKQEQEIVADNFVLSRGVTPSSYAEMLIDIVKSIQASDKQSVLATNMGSYSFFPSRMKAILSKNRIRKQMTKFQINTASLLLLLVFTPIAVITADTNPVQPAALERSIPDAGRSVVTGILSAVTPILPEVPLLPEAPLDASIDAPLQVAVLKGDMARVEFLLLTGIDPDIADRNGVLPLHLALQTGNYSIIELLLEGGANANQENRNGELLLDQALQSNNYSIIELLLEGGANPNRASGNGELPLHQALQSKNYRIVELLLAAGANPNTPDADGVTPIEYSQRESLEKIEELLFIAGATYNR